MKNAIHMLQSVTDTICLSLIITTEDDKVIVIDGGFPAETDHFLESLRKITGQERPHIDTWFLTHPHDDHISVFLKIMREMPDAVDVDCIRFNFPSIQFLAREDKSAEGTMTEFTELLPVFADRVCFTSGGDEFDIGAAHIEVLYTHDYELNRNVCNNASMVFAITLGGKRILITGDSGVEAGQKMLRLVPEKLKADICQMAHHGQNGCDRAFYEAVSPEICIWPTPTWLWNNDAGKGYNTHFWQTVIVQGWMNEIGVKTNCIAKDGDQVCEL